MRGEVSTVTDGPKLVVKGQSATRVASVLDLLVLTDRGHEVAPAATYGKERLVLLAQGLYAEERGLDHELGDIRSLDVAVAHEDLPAEQILRCDR